MNSYFTEYENLEVKPIFGLNCCFSNNSLIFISTGTRAYAQRSTTTRSIL